MLPLSRRFLFPLAIAVLLVIPPGCSEAPSSPELTVEGIATGSRPVVTIVAAPMVGLVAPADVEFFGGVTGGDGDITYQWLINGEAASTEPSFTYQFTEAGDFEVGLDVEDGDGDSAGATLSLSVGEDHQPTAEASVDVAEGQAPLAVVLSCTATAEDTPSAISWQLGDGTTAVGGEVPYTYLQAGEFNPTCTVVDGDGDEASSSVTVTATEDTAPLIRLTADAQQGIAPMTVEFAVNVTGGESPYSYAWDFGDGSESADEADEATYTYEEPGLYQAVVTVQDGDGDEGVGTFDVLVTTEDNDLSAVLIGSVDSGEAPLSVDFEVRVSGASEEVTFDWDFGDETVVEGGDARANHEYVAVGFYTAVVTLTDGGRMALASFNVDVVETEIDPVDVVLSASPASGEVPVEVAFTATTSRDGEFRYDWDYGDGDEASDAGASVTHTYDSVGTYRAILTLTDEGGTQHLASTAVTVSEVLIEPVDVVISAEPSNGVVPFEASMTATTSRAGEFRYDWDYGDGEEASDAGPSVDHIYTVSGDYRAILTLTDEGGEQHLANIDIRARDPEVVNHPPEVTVNSPDGYCFTTDALVQLEADGTDEDEDFVTIEWIFESVPPGVSVAFNSRHDWNPTFEPLDEGDYHIRAIVSDGEHRVASDPIVIEAGSSVTEVEVVESGTASGQAGAEVETAPQVLVRNQCGALLPEALIRLGYENMSGESRVWANDQGLAEIEGLEFGRTAGSGTVTIRKLVNEDEDGEPVYETLAELGFDITPGPPALLVLPTTEPVEVNGEDLVLGVELTDEFRNPVGDQTLSLLLLLQSEDGETHESARFRNAAGELVPRLDSLDVVEGQAVVAISNTAAVPVFVTADELPDGLRVSALQQLYFEDFEGDEDYETQNGDGVYWEKATTGEPAPATAPSGSTMLRAYVREDRPYYRASVLFPVESGLRLDCEQEMTVRFWQWMDVGLGEGCAMGVSNLDYYGCYGREWPEPDYDVEEIYTCDWDHPGVIPTSMGTWVQASYTITTPHLALPYVSLHFDVPYLRGGEWGAGMFIDDVEVLVESDTLRIDYVAGPAAQVLGEVGGTFGNINSTCPSPATATFWVADAFDNVLQEKGTEVTFGWADDLDVTVASGERTNSVPLRVETDEDGTIILEIGSETLGQFDLAAELEGVVDSGTGVETEFEERSCGECAVEGLDLDALVLATDWNEDNGVYDHYVSARNLRPAELDEYYCGYSEEEYHFLLDFTQLPDHLEGAEFTLSATTEESVYDMTFGNCDGTGEPLECSEEFNGWHDIGTAKHAYAVLGSYELWRGSATFSVAPISSCDHPIPFSLEWDGTGDWRSTEFVLPSLGNSSGSSGECDYSDTQFTYIVDIGDLREEWAAPFYLYIEMDTGEGEATVQWSFDGVETCFDETEFDCGNASATGEEGDFMSDFRVTADGPDTILMRYAPEYYGRSVPAFRLLAQVEER